MSASAIPPTHARVIAALEVGYDAARVMYPPTNTHPGMSLQHLRWMVEAAAAHGRYPLAPGD